MLEGHTQDVKSLIWHPSEIVLFSASYDDTIKIWVDENDDWYCGDTLEGHVSTVWGLSLSEDGNTLTSCSDDRSVRVWKCHGVASEENAWKCEFALEDVHKFAIYSVACSKFNNVIATGGADNAITLLLSNSSSSSSSSSKKSESDTDLQCVATISSAHDGDVNCVSWNPCKTLSHLLVSSGDDGLARVWSLIDSTHK
jgi:WD40 repeat protein